MAIGKKPTPTGGNRPANTNKNNQGGAKQSEFTYKYSRNGSVNYWQAKETLLKASVRKGTKEGANQSYNDLTLNIYNLDEDGKMIKLEENKYDQGYFQLSPLDILKVIYNLKKMVTAANSGKDSAITGVIINHISPDTNSGSQFEIVNTADGFFVSIMYVENANVTQDWNHRLSNDQKVQYYNEKGEAAEKVVNMDLIALLTLFESSYALIAGIGDAIAELHSGSASGRTTGGMINKSRNTIGSKRSAEGSDDGEDGGDEDGGEEEAPTRTSSNKKSGSKPLTSSNMKSLLEEDEE